MSLREQRLAELRAEIERLEAERNTPGGIRQELAQRAKVCPIEELPEIPVCATVPWSHQLRAYWFLWHKLGLGEAQPNGGALLAMDMGTGKTKVSIDVIQNCPNGHFLVAAPLAVVPTWPAEIATHANSTQSFRVVPLPEGTVSKRTDIARREWDIAAATGQQAVFVINHESLWREPFGSWALSKEWAGLIVDECHRAKSAGGKFSKFAHVVSRRAAWRLGLTGTPMPRDHMDIYAQGRFIDPSVYGTSFTKHKAYFGIWAEFDTKRVSRGGKPIVARKLIGVRNETEFKRRLDHLSYRVEADDVLDLPPAVYQDRYCTLDRKEQRVYNELKGELIAEINGGFVTASNVLTKILRLQQIVQGVVEDEDGKVHRVGESKKKALKDYLLDLDKDEPVVVFCNFHSDLDQVAEAAADLDRGCLELSGRVNQLQEFKDGGGPIIAVQIKSGGLGVDLSRAAYSVYFCPTYDGGAYRQSLRRTRRPTKHLHGSFIYTRLIAARTIDTVTYKSLDSKHDLSERLLAGIRGLT